MGLRGIEPRTSCMSGRHSEPAELQARFLYNFPDVQQLLISREELPAAGQGGLSIIAHDEITFAPEYRLRTDSP